MTILRQQPVVRPTKGYGYVAPWQTQAVTCTTGANMSSVSELAARLRRGKHWQESLQFLDCAPCRGKHWQESLHFLDCAPCRGKHWQESLHFLDCAPCRGKHWQGFTSSDWVRATLVGLGDVFLRRRSTRALRMYGTLR